MRTDTTRCAECSGPLSRIDIEVTGEDTCGKCRCSTEDYEPLKPCGCNHTQRCPDCDE